MRTYTMITKPYRIRLNVLHHTLSHIMYQSRIISYKKGMELWCCKVKSNDHVGGESLMLFNHSFITTFKRDSETLKKKWIILRNQTGDWKTELDILTSSYSELTIK